jgi:signal transduction histidine kinase
MQNWLLDNFALLLLVLSIAALVFASAWWRTRKRNYGLAAVSAVALLGLVCLLVYLLPLLFGETDSQQIERKVRTMAAAVKTRNLDQIFSHISESFRFGSLNKAAFRRKAEEALNARQVAEVVVWE